MGDKHVEQVAEKVGAESTDGTGRPVYWTRFPARSIPSTQWSDHVAAHRTVMRMFDPALPGKDKERRAASGILYRIDVLAGEPVVLVQSRVAPELVPPQTRHLQLSERSWAMEVGDRIRFRVAVNALRRNGRRNVEIPVRPADAPDWLAERLRSSVGELEVLNHWRDSYQRASGRGLAPGKPPKLTVDTFDALGTVNDVSALSDVRLNGLGRARAYGCGLMTAQRIVSQ